MLRILALLATVATAATLSGGANAHPPDISVLYGAPSHSAHGHSGYAPSRHHPPVRRGGAYGASAYGAPRYTAPRVRSYARPVYDATPVYSKSYATPAYRAPVYAPPVHAAPRVESRAGYAVPRYGYRGRGYVQPRNLHAERPLPPSRHRSYGPYSRVPTSEGLNYGYSGGPTYGSDDSPVINGVRVNRNPN